MMQTAYKVDHQSVSMGASFNSTSIDIRHYTFAALQVSWSAAPEGTFKIQGSVDNSTWVDIADTSKAIVAADASYLWNLKDLAPPYIRIVWTRTSGTATCLIKFFLKGLA